VSGQRRVRALAWLTVAVVALLLLASGVGGIALQSGEPLPLGAILALLVPGRAAGTTVRGEPLGEWVAWVFWALSIFTVLCLMFSRALRQRVLRMLPVYLAVALMLYAVSRVLRDNGGATDDGGRSGDAPLPADLGISPPALPQFAADPPRWLLLLLGALIVALGLALAWLLVRRRRQQPVGEALADLAQEARQALDALDAGGDVRATVLQCYKEMARVLRRQRGLQRQEAMTPREFELLLAGAGLRDDHIGQLTRLFERVRYGAAAASERDEQEARACLSAIVQAYGQPV
jgi:hypothetical protein